jgi:ERCC4-type nuclease
VIYLTTAANDRDLVRLFGDLAMAVPIPYGDFIFHGKVNGEVVRVCGERKKFSDLVACINDGRHVQQVQSAHEADFQYYFLVLEAIWRETKDGEDTEFMQGNRWIRAGMSYQRVDAYLNELTYLMGVTVKYSKSSRETVRIVRGMHDFFEDTEAHSSLKKFYSAPMSPVLLTRPSLVRRVAKELPDIGWERSFTIEQRWSTVREMVNAPADEWIELEGIGKGIASKIDQELG